jgi:dienelactone hydrolase
MSSKLNSTILQISSYFLIIFSTSLINAAEFINERVPTDFVENGKKISLEIIIVKPNGPGPFPTIMFNHGSSGTGANPKYIKRSYNPNSVAFFFTKRGWMIAFPQRRGRGRSDGLYNEGLEPNRNGYSCSPQVSLTGMTRALQDLDVVVKYLKGRSDVDGEKMLIGGISRGGILSIVYTGTHPDEFIGAINFAGGWMGKRCSEMEAVHKISFKRGSDFKKQTIWLYGENDSHYSLKHCQNNFDLFVKSGGKGVFLSYYLPPGKDGHSLLYYPQIWMKDVDLFIKGIN